MTGGVGLSKRRRTDRCVCYPCGAATAAGGIAEGQHTACRIGAFLDPMIVIAADHPDASGAARPNYKPDVMRPNGDDAGGRTGSRTTISGERDSRGRARAVKSGALQDHVGENGAPCAP